MIKTLQRLQQLRHRLRTRLRRFAAETRLWWADVEIQALCDALDGMPPCERRFRLKRRLVAERAKQALARAAYQATLPPGERVTWIDA